MSATYSDTGPLPAITETPVVARSAAPRIDPSRPHIIALDPIRLSIMVFVVSVHTLAFGGGHVGVVLGAFTTVFHTSRELFFLLTALVLTYNYGHRGQVRWLTFMRRRYWLVVPAYVAWSLVYLAADGHWPGSVPAAAAAFWHDLLTARARYHLYFLLVTMQMYLLFPVLRWVLRKTAGHHLALFLAACAYQIVLTAALQHHLVRTGWLAGWLNGAGLGIWLESYVLYIVAGALAGWHFGQLSAFTRRHARVSSVALVAGVGAAGRGARHRRFFAAGSASSFGIYLAHPLVLQGVLALASATGVLAAVRSAPSALEVLVLLSIAVPLIYSTSWAIASAARRTPLSLMLTGREYRSRKSRAGAAGGREEQQASQ